jgi:hypothetical protein
MDLLSAVLACSLHADSNVVAAIAIASSHGNPYAVLDANAEQGYEDIGIDEPRPAKSVIGSADEGLVEATRISAQGGAPLLGLLAVPPGWAAMFQRSVRDLFDPCINIAVASAMLSNFEYECGARASRRCVLRKYGQAVGLRFLVDEVFAELSSARLRTLLNDAETRAHEAGVLARPNDEQRVWGPDRIFFRALPRVTRPMKRPSDGQSTTTSPRVGSRSSARAVTK